MYDELLVRCFYDECFTRASRLQSVEYLLFIIHVNIITKGKGRVSYLSVFDSLASFFEIFQFSLICKLHI